nr:ABC transporter substrate-binding protein [Tepidanaerobacter syntrophicus]
MFGPSVFQTLLTYDKDLNFVGELAEKWEVLDDYKTFRFFLRKGVQFHHNYGEMKASDVAFTFERMKDPEVKATYTGPALGVNNMAEIIPEDDYILKIVLKEKDINFLYKVAGWYGYVISEKAVKEMGDSGFALNPIGTGPYAFDKGIPGEKTEVVKHENYWGNKAKIDRIIFHIISEPATLFNAFESGEIDFMPIVDTQKLLEYKAQPDKYYIDSTPGRQLLYVGMNYQDKNFKNKKVREALTYAIDRDDIIQNYFMGLEKPAKGVLPELTKYSVNDKWNPEYNPQKAKALLEEAGYPDGFKTEFYCPNDQISMGPATLVQAYLSQSRIDAELKAVDFGVFIDTVRNGKAPIWLLYDSTGILPDETLRRYTSSQIPGSNWCCLNDPVYDKLVEAALTVQNEEDKKEAYEKAQLRLIDQCILYPLCTYTQHSVMHKKVKGFKLEGDLATSFENVYIEEQ